MGTLAAGFGESVITPQVPCDLSGYGYYSGRKADTVLDDLKARVVFLHDEKDNRLVLISCDLIGFSIEFSDGLRKKISSNLRMPLSHILLACTHTHSGPPTCYLRGMGEIDSSYLVSVAEKFYVKKLTEKAGPFISG